MHFVINQIEQQFNIETTSVNTLRSSHHVVLAGHLKDMTVLSQIIVRSGVKATDLSIKEGAGGYLVEIMVPPHDYAVFTGLTRKKPSACVYSLPPKDPPFFQIISVV